MSAVRARKAEVLAWLLAQVRVLREQLRFVARRLRPSRAPRDTGEHGQSGGGGDAAEFFRAAAAPGPLHGHLINGPTPGDGPALRPLRVVSHRDPWALGAKPANPASEQFDQAADHQVDPPTEPVDLSHLHRTGWWSS